MKSISNELIGLIEMAISASEYGGEEIALTIPDEQFGDFATNIALVVSKKTGEVPRKTAEKIRNILLQNSDVLQIVTEINIAGPGFINFVLKHEFYLKELCKITTEENIGKSLDFEAKTAVIDYSSPNIAKRFGIGHLRSTVIGQAIYNLLKSQGYKVIGINHLGDWGTQFGKLMVALKKWNTRPITELSFSELESYYVRFHQEAELDATLVIEAREAFKRLEDGEVKERKIWKELIHISLEEFDKIYDLLNVHIDETIGESFYLDKLETVVSDAKNKGILEESQGAQIVRFPDEDLTPALLKKSDGASTYCLRDLAAIRYRKERWNPDLYIYEVGSEQKLHFEQVFRVATRLGYGTLDQFIHIAHGEIRTKEGRMSTRKGNTIKLDDVINKLIEKASILSPDKESAIKVGLGALKYNDLKRSPSSGYVFDWDEMLSLEGNTGPYLQYAYVRTTGVLEKSEIRDINPLGNNEFNQDELRVIKKICQFPDITLEATKKLYPPILCNYLYNLSQLYNTFYNNNPIIKAESLEKIKLRLALTKATRIVLHNGMDILGIPTVQRM